MQSYTPDKDISSMSHQGDLNNFIDNIRTKLQQLKQEEYKKDNKPIEIPPEASLLIKNRTNIQSPKEYQAIINKQRQMQFRKKGVLNETASSTDTPEHLLNNNKEKDTVNLLEDLNLACYQRAWGKLEHELKINRAMHFVQREIAKHKLTQEESKKLRILLVGAINKRLITKKADVNYNENTGQLVEIYDLQFDPVNRTYVLADYVPPQQQIASANDFAPPNPGSSGYVSRVSKLSPEQNKEFKNLMLAQTKNLQADVPVRADVTPLDRSTSKTVILPKKPPIKKTTIAKKV